MTNITNKINSQTLFQGIHLTKNALMQISYLIGKNPKNKGIRIKIKKSGCAGFRIVMELAQEKQKEEIEFLKNGATLFISKKILTILEGMEIDFVTKGLNQIFQFKNYNTKNYCGCGESFEL
ncbi:iron-sulfur cluster assembly accessory protein [Buchnera aphidicola]|uniref:iron-sulfur cluster assembly accessory protein n=1 Tax=Buchnera aphidicola TaxID=9 RepID=UPI0034648BB2